MPSVAEFPRAPFGRRRDRWTAVVVIALVAVVVVLVAGQGSPGRQRASPTTIFPAGTAPVTTAPAGARMTTATTATMTTTPNATTVPEVAVTTVRTEDLGGALLPHPAGIELFAWDDADELVRIEVDRGRVTRTNVPPFRTTGPIFFLAGAHDVIVRPADNVPGYRVPDGEEPQPLANELAHGASAVYPGPDPNHYWTVVGDGFNELLLVDTQGRPVGAPITIPGGYVTGPDGAGQMLVQATGGVYVASASGFSRVSSGVVIATGATGFVSIECDEGLVCSLVVTDRASGRRATLGPPVAASHAFTPGLVSPDGRHAAYVAADRAEQALYALDLATGRETTISDILRYAQSPGAWSADGRYLFYIDDNLVLRARDLVDGSDVELVKGLRPVDHLAARVLVGP